MKRGMISKSKPDYPASQGNQATLFEEYDEVPPPQSQSSSQCSQQKPYSLATRLGDSVRTILVVQLVALLVLAACAVAWLAIKPLLWGANTILRALGKV